MKRIQFIPFCFLLTLVVSCNDTPKVIQATSSTSQNNSSGIFDIEEATTNAPAHTSSSANFGDNLHRVVAQEILPTKKYVYVKVSDGGAPYWVASRKQEITIGETYYYRNALLKTNFESKEHNRMFDSIYLVSNLVSHDHGTAAGMQEPNFSSEGNEPASNTSTKQDIPTHTEKITAHKGSISIAELVANPASFEGKTVQLTGRVVKVNPNIMNRNWLHLQDGTKNDYDLVVTSNTFVAEGVDITIKAEVQLNRDFGAGYRYDLILENGVIVQ